VAPVDSQVLDRGLGLDLLLDIQRRRLDHQVAPVLLNLAAPDKLRVKVAIAPYVSDGAGSLLLALEHRLILGGRDIQPRDFVVCQGLDGSDYWLFRHATRPLPYATARAL